MKNWKDKKLCKRIIDFLEINIIVFLIGLCLGIVALGLDIDILAKLAIVIMSGSAIIDKKGNIRL